MSDYCKSCSYNYKTKFDDNSCPLNTLYWDFLMIHESKLKNNPRMMIPYAALKKLNEQDRKLISEKATKIKLNLNKL